MNLGETFLCKIVESHKEVLQRGLRDKNKHAAIICCETGDVRYVTIGSPKTVIYKCRSDKNYIVIHNHPNNSTFSLQDLYEFYDGVHHKCLAVQGHNGISYVLSRDSKNNGKTTRSEIREILDNVQCDPNNTILSYIQKREIAIFMIARRMGWTFLKKEVS